MSPTINAMLRGLAATIALWRERAAQRRTLSELDDKALADIGLTRGAARGEALRPFWRGEEQEERPRQHGRPAAMAQPVFVAFREKESGRRATASGRRNRPGPSAGSIIGNRR
jgi:uncharacterized protein YjiS (DUF1127 family)